MDLSFTGLNIPTGVTECCRCLSAFTMASTLVLALSHTRMSPVSWAEYYYLRIFFKNEDYLSQILLNKLSLVLFMLSLYLLAPGPHTWLWQLLSAPAVCICCHYKQLILTVFSLSHTFILMSRSLLCCDMGHSDNSRGSLFWEKIGCLSFSNRDFVV